ncbi:MAG: YraN family protein [Pseudomonadota bacterium]|nr:YraN family protein [Pseudomonadota bacterium]
MEPNSSSTGRTTPGAQGEAAEGLACAYLQARGLTLVERNFRCRCGELDLVMRDGAQWVFVEVRLRRSVRFGHPAETVTRAKQRRLIGAASLYLQRHRLDVPSRFDVVAISRHNGRLTLDWIRDAFQAD